MVDREDIEKAKTPKGGWTKEKLAEFGVRWPPTKGWKAKLEGTKFRETKPKAKKIRAFYSSYEWRRVRYEVLKRDNRRCKLCGATPETGAVLNVDHIKPLKKFWSLRLDPDNLQTLCNVCNHGKGNWDQTDWRKKD